MYIHLFRGKTPFRGPKVFLVFLYSNLSFLVTYLASIFEFKIIVSFVILVPQCCVDMSHVVATILQIVIVIAQSSAPCHALVCTDSSVSSVRDFSLDSRPTHDSTTAAKDLINHSSTSTSHHSGAHLPFRRN